MLAVRKKPESEKLKLKIVHNDAEVLDAVDESSASGGGSTSIEPRFPDDEGDDENATSVAAAMLSVTSAVKCFKADPTLGDPVALARRFYDFIFE